MSLVLIDNADVLVTMDDERREIKDAALLIRDNVIEMLGASAELHQQLQTMGLRTDRQIDASGCVVVP